MATDAMEREVKVFELEARRPSMLPAKLLRASMSGKGSHGVLFANEKGITLCMSSTKRLSRIATAMKRTSTKAKVRELGHLDQIVSAELEDDAQLKQQGRWVLVMCNDEGKTTTYRFESASVFGAVGWVQGLRKLRGMKPIPVVAALGETGSGKSLLCSALAGLGPENAVFRVGHGTESETSDTHMYLTTWFGRGNNDEQVIIIDTPGLNDSQGRDDAHVSDMLQKLGELGAVNTFLILVNAGDERIGNALAQMLRVFEKGFGESFWEHAMLVFTHWFMDRAGQKRRKVTAEDKARLWNDALSTRFPAIGKMRRADHRLKCFFIDSDADPEDAEAAGAANEQLRELSIFARQGREFDCRDALPDEREVAALFQNRAVPEEAADLAAILRSQRLHERLPGLVENGIYTMDQLNKIKGRDLIGFFQWTEEEVLRLREEKPPTHLGPNYAVVNDFRMMGLPHAALERSGLNAEEVLEVKENKVRETFNFGFPDMLLFRDWRANALKGTPVTCRFLWEDDVVMRSDTAWTYDHKDRPKQKDLSGPGMVVCWRDMDGKVRGQTKLPSHWRGHPDAFRAPLLPGWARIYWFTSGYTKTYRVGADNKFELTFADAEAHGILNRETGRVNLAEFKPVAPGTKLRPSELRCTFGFPKGLRYPHWSKFDVRPDACRAHCGLVPGDVVRVQNHEAALVGLNLNNEGRVQPYFFVTTNNQGQGAGLFDEDDKFDRVRTMPLHEYAHDEVDCHSDDGIDNDALYDVSTKLHEDFNYPLGTTFQQPGTFDVRDEILERFNLNVVSGSVLFLNTPQAQPRRMVVIGVSMHECEVPRLWVHMEGNPGASVIDGLHEDIPFKVRNPDLPSRFTRTETREVVRQVQVRNLVPPFPEPSIEERRNMQLNLTFEFPRGAGAMATMAKFDISASACRKLSGYRSGEVLDLPGNDGRSLTVIGVLQNPETGLPAIWFHFTGHRGAGMFPDFYEMYQHLRPREELRDLNDLKRELAEMPAPEDPMLALLRAMGALTGAGGGRAEEQARPGESEGGGSNEGGPGDRRSFDRWLDELDD